MVAQTLHLGWHNPVRITWGCGAFNALQFAQPMVLIADRGALGGENEEFLRSMLGVACKSIAWFDGGLASVQRAKELCDRLWPVLAQYPECLIVAVGGGSTLDLAKAVRFRFSSDITAEHVWRTNTLPTSFYRHPLWLIPTTAGTGSEVTPWATLWDTLAPNPKKLSWAPQNGFAECAIIDPDLSRTCPSTLSRDCALDSLSHALESLWNINRTPITETLAIEAARTVIAHLPALLESSKNHDAQTEIVRASLLAGLAMSQTRTALAHALSYQLTLEEHLPHGHAVAVWLPMVWEIAVKSNPSCQKSLDQIFAKSADFGVSEIVQWLSRIGIEPRDLRQTPSGRKILLAELSSARGRNFAGNYLVD
ncbi:MAG: iron-containing alcohol dehydrogenase [Betaproteobacteria bacterium]|nr:iron-containing alcohol dehydrogenase [Betaproteobacteria bacterium]